MPAMVVDAFLSSASRAAGSAVREPKRACALSACSSGPVLGLSTGGGVAGGGTDCVLDCTGFKGAFSESSEYSSMALGVAKAREPPKIAAGRDAFRAGLHCTRLSVDIAREVHCERILWRVTV